jgi:hypothetical protein
MQHFVCFIQPFIVTVLLYFTLLKPEDTQRHSRRVGKPNRRWFQSVEKHVKNTGVRNWRRKSRGGDEWRKILEETGSPGSVMQGGGGGEEEEEGCFDLQHGCTHFPKIEEP